mgnify:CR=1 FL=1
MTSLKDLRYQHDVSIGGAGLDSAAVTALGGGAGVSVLETLDSLPISNLEKGQTAFVKSNTRFYISNGSGWYNVATINLTPTMSISPAGTIVLATDGVTTSTVTITAQDSDNPDAILTYSVESDGNMLGNAVISQDSSVFTIRPLSEDSGATGTTFTLTFKTTDQINTASATKDFSLSFGDSRWFIDEFTTDTTSSSEYTFTNTNTAATWNNAGYIYVSTGDNHYSEIEWTPSDAQPLRDEGRVFAVFHKTADWPSDNACYIDLKHSNGTDYYRTEFKGSAYPSSMIKTVSGSNTDTQSLSYSFDDQTSSHTFEVQWNSDTIKFYVDGTLEGTLTPSNNTTPIEISSFALHLNQIQGTLTAIGYQDYGSDGSAYPFI